MIIEYTSSLIRISYNTMLLTKTTAAQSEGALSYDSMRGLYFLAVVFAATITSMTFNWSTRRAQSDCICAVYGLAIIDSIVL